MLKKTRDPIFHNGKHGYPQLKSLKITFNHQDTHCHMDAATGYLKKYFALFISLWWVNNWITFIRLLSWQAVRSHEDAALILWLNLPTGGVVSAAKQDFFLTTVTTLLAAYKRNAVAIWVHCNRAGDPSRTVTFLPFPQWSNFGNLLLISSCCIQGLCLI